MLWNADAIGGPRLIRRSYKPGRVLTSWHETDSDWLWHPLPPPSDQSWHYEDWTDVRRRLAKRLILRPQPNEAQTNEQHGIHERTCCANSAVVRTAEFRLHIRPLRHRPIDAEMNSSLFTRHQFCHINLHYTIIPWRIQIAINVALVRLCRRTFWFWTSHKSPLDYE